MAKDQMKSANELALDRTNLAARRTLMASDRSLLATLRTSVSMIGFGFTIYKFLADVTAKQTFAVRDTAPRDIGLLLTGLGTVTLVMEMISYYKDMKELGRDFKVSPWRMPLFEAGAIAAMGLWLFLVILTRAFSGQ